MMQHVQTQTEIKALLRRYGARPRKRLGQHFLIDGNLMRRLAAAAEIGAEDVILEVGAGTGGLTDLLAAAAGRVIAVEADRALQAILRDRFAGAGHVTLLGEDVLATRNRLSATLTRELGGLDARARGRLKLVANLPYGVASPVLVNLLLSDAPPVLYGFTVQKEVADRFLASPGTKAYGPLTILFQALCDVRPLANVPPSAFWPPPRVHSTMLRIIPAAEPRYAGQDAAGFMGRVRAGFVARRKTLRFNLRKQLGAECADQAGQIVDLDRRAEQLDVDEWVAVDALLGRLGDFGGHLPTG
jgi:16S rRNA (adenine1518-N6/adenine1519-N6)-dimethyltransferase